MDLSKAKGDDIATLMQALARSAERGSMQLTNVKYRQTDFGLEVEVNLVGHVPCDPEADDAYRERLLSQMPLNEFDRNVVQIATGAVLDLYGRRANLRRGSRIRTTPDIG